MFRIGCIVKLFGILQARLYRAPWMCEDQLLVDFWLPYTLVLAAQTYEQYRKFSILRNGRDSHIQ